VRRRKPPELSLTPLFALCVRKKRAAEALAYNGLVQNWPEIVRLVREVGTEAPVQRSL